MLDNLNIKMTDDRTVKNSGLRHEGAKDHTKPIVDNVSDMHLPGVAYGSNENDNREWYGSTSLTLNPDGTYNLSGQLPGIYLRGDPHNYDFHIVFGVKSDEGSTLFFEHSMVIGSPNLQNYIWNRHGSNATLKDNFASFAKKHDWHASWGLKLSASQPPGLAPAPSSGGGGSSGPSVGDVLGDVATGLGILLSFF
jgi:hypothetical protein